jgi:hypothetical protein
VRWDARLAIAWDARLLATTTFGHKNCTKGRPEAALSCCQMKLLFFTPNVAKPVASFAPES